MELQTCWNQLGGHLKSYFLNELILIYTKFCRYYAEYNCDFDLTYFPFDVQVIKINCQHQTFRKNLKTSDADPDPVFLGHLGLDPQTGPCNCNVSSHIKLYNISKLKKAHNIRSF